jgi:hypothetical protein
MDEAQWLAATNPDNLLYHLQNEAASSERKARLFACACCRRIWHLLSDERSRNAIEVLERFVDRKASKKEMDAAIDASATALNALDQGKDPARYYAAGAVYHAADDIVDPLADAEESAEHAASAAADAEHDAEEDDDAWGQRNREEEAEQARLVREVFGNPFRKKRFKRDWRSSDVRTIAAGIYEERAFDRLPILADALEEAGCTDEALLEHLRQGGPHVRGCWALDRAIGKK